MLYNPSDAVGRKQGFPIYTQTDAQAITVAEAPKLFLVERSIEI